MRHDLKKSATEIGKLTAKLSKQDSLVTKYFGLDNEMLSLHTQLLLKDNEIATLKNQLKKSGGAILEESSDLEDGSPRESAMAVPKRRAPPSPDKELSDFFGGGGGGSFGNM